MTLREAIQAKYALPHFISLFEVRDATGFDSTRSADAIAVSLYRSRGYEVHGFEMKVSRADWLKELRDPAKAEEIGKFCDYFWLLTPHVPEQAKLGDKQEVIAKLEEIPGSWGWQALKGERLKVMKPAQKLPAIAPDRPMLCSLLYATKEHFLAEANRIIEKTVDERLKEKEKGRRDSADYYKTQHNDLLEKVRKFEEASGLHIIWAENIPKMGEAVRRLMRSDAVADYVRQLEYSRNGASQLVGDLERAIEEVKAVQTSGLPDLLKAATLNGDGGQGPRREFQRSTTVAQKKGDTVGRDVGSGQVKSVTQESGK